MIKPTGCCFLFLALSTVQLSSAGVTTVSSITQIDGPRITFDNPAQSVTQAFADAQMAYDGFDSGHVGAVTGWVMGNVDAPISHGAIGFNFTATTTGSPWSAIGLSVAGNQVDFDHIAQPSWSITLLAFDIDGHQIGSVTKTFHAVPADTVLATIEGAYNAAAVFLGFQSDVPIYSISTLSSDVNINWDNVAFTPVPEPSTFALGLLGFPVRWATRRLRARS